VTEVGVSIPAFPLEIIRTKLGDGPTFQEAVLFSSPSEIFLGFFYYYLPGNFSEMTDWLIVSH
jgi:hypothetical protein